MRIGRKGLNAATPSPETFAEAAGDVLALAERLQSRAREIVDGDPGDYRERRISESTGMFLAAALAEMSRIASTAVSVAAIYQYGCAADGTVKRANAETGEFAEMFEALRARCKALGESEGDALGAVHAAVGDLMTEHGLWGVPGVSAENPLAALMRAMGTPRESERKAGRGIGFGPVVPILPEPDGEC